MVQRGQIAGRGSGLRKPYLLHLLLLLSSVVGFSNSTTASLSCLQAMPPATATGWPQGPCSISFFLKKFFIF